VQRAVSSRAWSEAQFAETVTCLAEAGDGLGVVDLLRESHPCYAERGTAAIVRMRGWALLAFRQTGLPEEGLPFVLEELDAGIDPYLVAAAARALRCYSVPVIDFPPFVLQALTTMAGRDEPVSFADFGDYAVSEGGTSPLGELIETLAWLGPVARSILPEATELAARPGAFSRTILAQFRQAIGAIDAQESATCCALPNAIRQSIAWVKRNTPATNEVAFEDHNGEPIRFSAFFAGKPSIVVFFYTRCDNPLKCSLTISKLGRIQKLLNERGLTSQVRTAAVTYDPAFDLPDRMRDYGLRRGLRLGPDHRMLRAPGGIDALQRHFALGVSFLGSLVARHRIEAYVLRADGQVACSFERFQWNENDVVKRAIDTLQPRALSAAPFWGSAASLGVAFFPKCPICWAAYLSMFGIAGLGRIPYAPWLQWALAVLMAVNIGTVWLSARTSGRFAGAYLATAGAIAIGLSRLEWLYPAWGAALTAGGSFVAALQARPPEGSLRDLRTGAPATTSYPP
jgi:protein SCO1/2